MSDYRMLEITNNYIHLSRIGYSDEGVRLTIHDTVPYKFHVEVQLSRKDMEWLVAELQKELSNPRNSEMP
jgi:hypothetical protein